MLLADDHSIVIEGLRRVLEPAYQVIGAVSDGSALVEATRALDPDVVIADVSMAVLNGIEATRQIRQSSPRVKVVFFTMHSDPFYASEALRAGGSAYVVKSSAGSDILKAVSEALAGRTYVSASVDLRSLPQPVPPCADCLTPRRRAVVQMAAAGQSTKQISDALNISPRTVEFHRYQAMKSLGLHTIAELVQYAIKHHIVAV